MTKDDEAAWAGTLVAGVVVAGVVWGLLETLRRSVVRVEAGVGEVWAAGQRVAQNTQTTHLLTGTARQSAHLRDLLDGSTPAAAPAPGEPAPGKGEGSR